MNGMVFGSVVLRKKTQEGEKTMSEQHWTENFAGVDGEHEAVAKFGTSFKMQLGNYENVTVFVGVDMPCARTRISEAMDRCEKFVERRVERKLAEYKER